MNDTPCVAAAWRVGPFSRFHAQSRGEAGEGSRPRESGGSVGASPPRRMAFSAPVASRILDRRLQREGKGALAAPSFFALLGNQYGHTTAAASDARASTRDAPLSLAPESRLRRCTAQGGGIPTGRAGDREGARVASPADDASGFPMRGPRGFRVLERGVR